MRKSYHMFRAAWFSLCLLFVFSLFAFDSANGQVTKVYIVRHAEKDTSNPNNTDPALTEQGKQRAQKLVEVVSKENIAAVFSTKTLRTMSTAEPVAHKYGLKIQNYDVREMGDLAYRIRHDYAGKTVLVIGHSNTLEPTVKSLGGTVTTRLDEHDYDNIFIVTISGQDKVNTELKKY